MPVFVGYNSGMPDDTPTGKSPEDPRPQGDSNWGDDSTMIAEKVGIVFYDDDQTPVDFVLYLLEQFLGYDEEKARMATELIRATGRASVAELLPAVAESTLRRMERAAAAAGYPFRMDIRPKADAA